MIVFGVQHMPQTVLAMFAATEGSPLNAGTLMVVAGIVAAARQKHPIGGWLLFFFFQVFFGLVIVGTTTRWTLLLPNSWRDRNRYLLFTLSNLPLLVVLAAVAGISIALIQTHDRRWVSVLRYALIIYGVLTLLKVQADILDFPSIVSRDELSLIFPCIWVVYFSISRRVKRVFPPEPGIGTP
jgi:hypothetical protein